MKKVTTMVIAAYTKERNIIREARIVARARRGSKWKKISTFPI